MGSDRLIRAFTFTYRGYRNRKERKPCQDYTTHRITDDCAAIALADGAGSARYAKVGARVAASTFVWYYTSEPTRIREAVDGFLDRVLRNVEEKAYFKSAHLRDLSTTLLGFALHGDEALFLHVGDGMALLLKDGTASVLSEGFRGEFCNETTFVTSGRKPLTLFGKLDDFAGVVLMSDGAQFIFFDRAARKPARALEKIVSHVGVVPNAVLRRELKRSLNSLPASMRYDDISLAVLKVVE